MKSPRILAFCLLLCACTPYRRALWDGDWGLHEGRYSYARQRYAEASARAPGGRAAARARNAAAAADLLLGRPQDAEAEFKKAYEALEGVEGAETARAFVLSNLAGAAGVQGRPADAAAYYRRAAGEFAKDPAAPALEASQVWGELGQIELAQRRFAEAERAYARALELRERALGKSHASLAPLLEDLAAAFEGQGKKPEADAAVKRARQISPKGS